jgi:uncharacterized protein
MSQHATDRSAPVVDDPDTGGFWRAANRGALAVQFCVCCDEPIHVPRPRCPACGGPETRWRDVEPVGSIYSWTVIRHQVHPAFPVPYTVILIALRDYPQVRLVGRLDGAVEPKAGQRVRARFATGDPDDPVIPEWVVLDVNEGEER